MTNRASLTMGLFLVLVLARAASAADGDQLIIVSDHAGDAELYLTDLDGKPMKSITHVGYCLSNTIVDFSPFEISAVR